MAAHSRPTEQNLFAIVQGGLDVELRDISLKVLLDSLDSHKLPGIAAAAAAGMLVTLCINEERCWESLSYSKVF